MNIVERYKDQIIELCNAHNVKELYLFGSVLSNRFNDSSDIDMVIKFSDVDLLEYFDNYMNLKEQLEELLQRPVDLLEDQAIRNPIFRRVLDREKKLFYERKSA